MKKKKEKKISFFTIILDVIIAIVFFVTVSLGAKDSYENFYSRHQTEQQNNLFEQKIEDDGFINREDFVPVIGEGVFQIKIDGLTDWIPIIEDYSDSLVNLEKGAIHLTQTGMPGDNRQIFTAGHRHTHYYNIEKVNTIQEDGFGTTIYVRTLYGEFEYTVHRTEIVDESNVGVINTGFLEQDELVLMTCFPFENWKDPDRRYLVYAYPKSEE